MRKIVPSKDGYKHARRKAVSAYQRARYGYSEVDTYSLHYHLSAVILGGLRRLRERALAYPVRYTPEQWDAILEEMIVGFAIAAEDSWDAGRDPHVKRALKLFTEHYFDLWD